jgi:hypothetical protein
VTAIERISPDEKAPYGNLLPIVDLLIINGNHALDAGFARTQAGWQCRMSEPIDAELVQSSFDLPANVEVSAHHDTILDRLSWCAIEGPGAASPRQRPG